MKIFLNFNYLDFPHEFKSSFIEEVTRNFEQRFQSADIEIITTSPSGYYKEIFIHNSEDMDSLFGGSKFDYGAIAPTWNHGAAEINVTDFLGHWGGVNAIDNFNHYDFLYLTDSVSAFGENLANELFAMEESLEGLAPVFLAHHPDFDVEHHIDFDLPVLSYSAWEDAFPIEESDVLFDLI